MYILVVDQILNIRLLYLQVYHCITPHFLGLLLLTYFSTQRHAMVDLLFSVGNVVVMRRCFVEGHSSIVNIVRLESKFRWVVRTVVVNRDGD